MPPTTTGSGGLGLGLCTRGEINGGTDGGTDGRTASAGDSAGEGLGDGSPLGDGDTLTDILGLKRGTTEARREGLTLTDGMLMGETLPALLAGNALGNLEATDTSAADADACILGDRASL